MTATRSSVTREVTITQRDGAEYTFEGIRLGFGTSHRASHLDHPPGVAPRPGERCSGCRWTEASIYWSVTDSKYIVRIVGRSAIPGEVDKIRVVWANDADAVLDSMLVTPPRRIAASDPNALELPQPNAHALEEAAEHDAELAAALRSWRSSDG